MYGKKHKDLTIKEILKYVSEWDLWRYYIPNVELQKNFCSPLRKDSNPSANLFVSRSGSILMKDFSLGTFNIWQYLQLRYSLTFHEALVTVNNDFDLKILNKPQFSRPTMEIFGIITNEKIEESKEVIIQIKKRKWNLTDRSFWYKKYGFTSQYLNDKYVIPVENYWVNDKLIYWHSDYNPAYSYEFGNGIRKIYRPFAKEYRFLTNAKEDVIQGDRFLINSADTLIITKSYKDVLLLTLYGFPSVAPQGESIAVPEDKLNEYRERFKNIFLLYDNDEAGIKYSKKYCEQHKLKPIFIPKDSGAKDASDFRELFGEKETVSLIKQLIQ